MNDATLIDAFLAKKKATRFETPHRNVLLQARRFVFDDTASSFLGTVIRELGIRILSQHEFAKPPYETTWVEVDQTAYWQGLTGTMPEFGSDVKVGFLYHKNKIWTVASNRQFEEPEILPLIYNLHTPISFEEELDLSQKFGTSRMGFRQLILGSEGIPETMFDDMLTRDLVRSHKLELIKEFERLNMSPSDMYSFLKGSAGDLKRMLVILLLLTRPDKPIISTSVVPRSSGLRKGRRVVYMDYHKVSIHIDQRTAIKNINLEYPTGIIRRRHEVRGHWVQTRKTRTSCEHEWDAITVDKFVCVKCGIKRWWRKNHLRGDASKGFTTKDYKVVQ